MKFVLSLVVVAFVAAMVAAENCTRVSDCQHTNCQDDTWELRCINQCTCTHKTHVDTCSSNTDCAQQQQQHQLHRCPGRLHYRCIDDHRHNGAKTCHCRWNN